MIGKDEIAEAARNADAISEEGQGLPAWWARHNVDVEGVTYVAMQRGLRAAMTLDGQDPRKLSQTRPQAVRLSPAANELMPILAAIWMDGLAAGVMLKQAHPSTPPGGDA